GGFSASQIGAQEWRGSPSYVSGGPKNKFWLQGGFYNPPKKYYFHSTVTQGATHKEVAKKITQKTPHSPCCRTAPPPLPLNFYGQDQWTRKRLTLQGGVRWDNGLTSYTSDPIGGPDYLLMPTQISFPTGSTQGIDWKDITPRVGASYDLFGDGKTAIK